MADPVGEMISEYRRAKGITRAEAAAAWSIAPRTLERYESRGVGRSIDGLVAALLRDALGKG